MGLSSKSKAVVRCASWIITHIFFSPTSSDALLTYPLFAAIDVAEVNNAPNSIAHDLKLVFLFIFTS
jgi:hypothetical protein